MPSSRYCPDKINLCNQGWTQVLARGYSPTCQTAVRVQNLYENFGSTSKNPLEILSPMKILDLHLKSNHLLRSAPLKRKFWVCHCRQLLYRTSLLVRIDSILLVLESPCETIYKMSYLLKQDEIKENESYLPSQHECPLCLQQFRSPPVLASGPLTSFRPWGCLPFSRERKLDFTYVTFAYVVVPYSSV